MIRRLVVVAVAAFLAGAAAATFIHVNSWTDVSVGSQTSYCGYVVQSASISFYCQRGE